MKVKQNLTVYWIGSHDPILDQVIFLALFQRIEMLIHIDGFFEFE